jgi:hypothetical protein
MSKHRETGRDFGWNLKKEFQSAMTSLHAYKWIAIIVSYQSISSVWPFCFILSLLITPLIAFTWFMELHRLIKMLFSNVCHSLPSKAIQVRDACDPFCVPNYHFSRFFVSASTFVGVFDQLRLSSIDKTFSQIVASERHMQISITVKSRIYLFW